LQYMAKLLDEKKSGKCEGKKIYTV
jgi:hypothetical protein